MAAVVVSVINLKGGVGKSTLTMMLGEFLAFRHGKNVLLVDMDAQANLSYCMVSQHNIERQERASRTTYHLFKAALSGREVHIDRFITRPPLVVSNIARAGMAHHGTRLEMVVSTPSVAQLDEELLRLWEDNRPMPEGVRHVLNQALQPVLGHYDYILIDCPPGLSLFSSAALLASHYFITPIIPEPLSLLGVNLVQDRARELKGRTVEFKGVILNIVKHYRKTHQRISGDLYETQEPKYQPFQYWLPDNETIRKLGEFDPDEQGQWALGVDQKFPSLHAKYSLSYQLSNPASGPLSRTNVEGPRYRLEERIERLTEEFEERCGRPPRRLVS